MTILLSLLAAASYGLADFVGGVTSKRTSPWAVALVAQLGGATLVFLLSLVTDGSPTSTDLWWCAAGGVGNGFGTAFLYRGLSSGRMGVVAPISGVGAVLVPVVVSLVTGERPPLLVWVGILAALPGIWLVSSAPAAEDVSGAAPSRSGVLDGVLAGLGFGSLFAALAQIPEEAGFLPLAINQLVAAGVIILVAVVLRQEWVPRERVALFGIVSGALGALATGLFMVATQGGSLTVAAVLTSLYPAFTILLAATVLREHVHRTQAVGLLLCGTAIALVAGAPAGGSASEDDPHSATVRDEVGDSYIVGGRKLSEITVNADLESATIRYERRNVIVVVRYAEPLDLDAGSLYLGLKVDRREGEEDELSFGWQGGRSVNETDINGKAYGRRTTARADEADGQVTFAMPVRCFGEAPRLRLSGLETLAKPKGADRGSEDDGLSDRPLSLLEDTVPSDWVERPTSG